MSRPISLTASLVFSVLLFLTVGSTRTYSNPPRTDGATYRDQIVVQNHRWTYTVHVPPQSRPQQPLPLVLILHGAAGNGASLLNDIGWGSKAAQAGFIAVAPNGLPARPRLPPHPIVNPRLWNSGDLRPGSRRRKIDDILFFRSLLEKLRQSHPIDEDRIYVAGYSNGGGMAFRLATEMPDFAAIAAVMSVHLTDRSSLAAPVSTLYMVGTEDPIIPIDGGLSKLGLWGTRTTPPVDSVIRRWAEVSGCPAAFTASRPARDVRLRTYAPCDHGTEFFVYFIEGQGHNWPGRKNAARASIAGPNRTTINATDVVWTFFRRHPRAVHAAH